MTTEKTARLWNASNYPKDWQLEDREIEAMFDNCCEGLATTNGDTAPVEVTVRQLLLLLRKILE